jgi:hypothetical protein
MGRDAQLHPTQHANAGHIGRFRLAKALGEAATAALKNLRAPIDRANRV